MPFSLMSNTASSQLEDTEDSGCAIFTYIPEARALCLR
jgi:hypothetical protein